MSSPDDISNPADLVFAPLDPIKEPPAHSSGREPDGSRDTGLDLDDPQRLNRTLDELYAMRGLEDVSRQVHRFATVVLDGVQRRQAGLRTWPLGLHMVFRGPPGTGKTTVARMIARIYYALGVLPSDKLIEVKREKIIGQYIGQTAPAMEAKIDEALGGVLFIDEAYSLTPPDTPNDFGREAIATLLPRMEDDGDKFALIVAGYADDMERFLTSNPGLRDRFHHIVDFPHYSSASLAQIAAGLAAQHDYLLAPEAVALLEARLARIVAAPPAGWANVRSLRHLLEGVITAQSYRNAAGPGVVVTDSERSLLTEADVRSAFEEQFPEFQ